MVISIRGGEVHLTSQNTFKWDLGDVYALDDLTLYWEGAYAVRYTVEVSEKMVQTMLRWMISLMVMVVRM